MRASLVVLIGICAATPALRASQQGAAEKQAGKAAKHTQAEWKEFTSKELGFTVELPGKAQLMRASFPNNGGEYDYVQVRFDDELVTFTVHCILKPESMDKKEAKAWLTSRAEKDSESSLFKGKKDVQLGEVPGVEIESGYNTIEGIKFDFWCRNFRVGRQVYSVRVAGPNGDVDPKIVCKFLDSFKLLNPSEQTRGMDRSPTKGVLLADSFVADNGVPLETHWMNTGAGWQHFGTGNWRIYDKRARLVIPDQGQDVIAANGGAADATLTCDMLTPDIEDAGMDAGLVVRLVDNDNYWLVAYRRDNLEVHKRSGGTFTSLVKESHDFKPKTTYHLKITVKGKTLTAYVDDKQVAQVTMDEFLTANKFGLRDTTVIKGHQPSWEHFKVMALEK
jgi:hypothetical protein